MSLIVEDGTGLSTAESYVSVADADAYHTSRGVADALWVDLDDEVKEPALRRATDYMVQTYRGRWKGTLVLATQALDWPRYNVYPDPSFLYALSYSIVPPEVKKAAAELAFRATTEVLLADVPASSQVVQETVGPITVIYAGRSGQDVVERPARYPAIDRTLAPLLEGGGNAYQGTARLG